MAPAADILVVMAKYPRPGAVKTRLARALGDAAACELYRAFLLDLAQRFGAGPYQLVWAVDPPGADLAAVVGRGSTCIDQRGADLGARMQHCFAALFSAGARRVVMIGADVPHIPGATLDAAFAALAAHDVALAPSPDGGYCLVGLRRAVDIFSGIAMSTPRVYAETARLVAAQGLDLAVLEPCFDIDEPSDLEALAALIHSGAVELPHTGAVLGRLLPGAA